MKLSKKELVKGLLGCLLLAVITNLLGGFEVVMLAAWVMCAVLSSMFWGVFSGYRTQDAVLSYIADLGEKGGISAYEVHLRGRFVTTVMLFVIPVYYYIATK